jgi:hypothetical protein
MKPLYHRAILSREERLMLARVACVREGRRANQFTLTASCLSVDDADEADGLREDVTEALQRYGFDDEYRLTSDGQVLEALMDKLHVEA